MATLIEETASKVSWSELFPEDSTGGGEDFVLSKETKERLKQKIGEKADEASCKNVKKCPPCEFFPEKMKREDQQKLHADRFRFPVE